jgi:hypothetical protein
MSLEEKILAITSAVPKLRKTGQNKDQGYKYLTIEDAVDSVRKLMIERKLLLHPTQLVSVERVADEKGYTFTVTFDWTLKDLESGEEKTLRVPGAGWDYHDKGVSKGVTGSRKTALILFFNLPIGDNPEQGGYATRGDAKAAAQAVGERKIAEAAGRGVKTAVEAMSQVEPEKKVIISRPSEHNGNYIIVTGLIAVPQLEKFFDDTASKRFKTKTDLVPYWRVPSEYEKGLLALCEKLGIEVEG